MLKKGVVILIVLCSIDFFSIILVPEAVLKGADIIGVSLTVAFLLLLSIYDNSKAIPKRFTGPIIWIFLATLISMFAAYGYRNQDIPVTLWAQRGIYYYLFYFLLSKLRLHPDFIVKMIIYLGTVYMVIYIAQNIVYPFELISYELFADRGTLRIFMPGAGYLQLGYFLSLYLFFQDYKMKNLLYIVGALVVFVLIGSRQLLGSIGLVTILFLLLNRVVKVKAILIPMMIASIIPLYYLFQDIFDAMMDVTNDQGDNLQDNIRVRAARYFLTEFFPTSFSYLSGNGAEGRHSIYGLKVQRLATQYQFHQSDLGLIGDYTKYGVLFLIGVSVSLFKVFSARLTGLSKSVKYFMLGVFLMLFTGSSAFGNGGNVVVICLIFYIIDANIYMEANKDKGEKGNLFLA